MAFSSSSLYSKNRHTIRSISLPTRSHPSTLQVEEEIADFKTWETSISCIPNETTICCGLTSLDRLYTSVDDVLSFVADPTSTFSPSTPKNWSMS
ncbi:hypothetical protein R6Q57_011695 [Mikania cordata]